MGAARTCLALGQERPGLAHRQYRQEQTLRSGTQTNG
jgi:hypothetical protein